MQLTRYTDYTLRTLIYLGLRPNQSATVSEIAEAYNISRNHLVKVAHNLGQLGYIDTMRGKSGGLTLTRDLESINCGEVVRQVEPNFALVECFDTANGGSCCIIPACNLIPVLARAEKAFMDVLNQYTLADVLANRTELAPLLGVTLSE